MSESDGRTGQILVNDALREFMKNSEDYIFVKDTKLIYHGSSEVFARMAGLCLRIGAVRKNRLGTFPAGHR
jgi:hypothetical protein